MLTDSYNLPTESVLRRHLSAQNIESKFAEREGTKVVIDYRGYEALTSFKVCEILGLRWLLIAKIDKAEVATAEYLAHESRYYPQLREAVRTSAPQYTSAVPPDPDRVVGLDDVQRVSGSQVLFTPGVSTCTAVILTLPGRFAYMAHVSPYDRIYGGSRTDLVSSVMKRVKDFEVADKELRNLEVVVVTPQIRYSQSIVKQLAESGIFLSQIRFLKNPEAACADVFFDQGSNETYVVWCFGDRYERTEVQLASTARDLGKLFLSL
jgi:hypothetical protein